MISQTAMRDQVTQHCYISLDKEDLTNRLEMALGRNDANDVLRKKLQLAIKNGVIPEYYPLTECIHAATKAGIFTPEEADAVLSFEMLREEIIKVNEFTFDLDRVVA